MQLGRPHKIYTDDADHDERGYLDSPAFHKFTVDVYEVISGPTTIGDIRRAMGDRFNSRWIQDALAALEALGTIRRIWGIPTRWTRMERKDRPKVKRQNVSPGRPADKTKPLGESFNFQRKVTA